MDPGLPGFFLTKNADFRNYSVALPPQLVLFMHCSFSESALQTLLTWEFGKKSRTLSPKNLNNG